MDNQTSTPDDSQSKITSVNIGKSEDLHDKAGISGTARLATDEMLPDKPEEPHQSDCCGTGCTPCVFDLYKKDLERWEADCRRIRRGIPASDVGKEDIISPSEYRRFLIESVVLESTNTYIYRFTISSGGKLGLKTGQHLILRYFTDGKPLTRQYTPISESEGYFDVMIKVYEQGLMSQYVKSWSVGTSVEWRGPFGNFAYTPNKWRCVVMLAAGTGIAPMAQVITTVLNNEDDETLMRLCYACQKYEDLILKESIDSWADYWNFSAKFYLSKDTPTRECRRRYGDEIIHHRITDAAVETEIQGRYQDTLVLICGTKSFDKDMIKYLVKIGVPNENYYKF